LRYVEVLYAENELFAAELTAVRAQAERYTELVNVYKAVGGGWIDIADRVTGTSAPPLAERAAKQPLL
jgi:multidrug efflux system outer membrane protein